MTNRTATTGIRRSPLASALAIAGLVLLVSACAFDPVTRGGANKTHPMADFRVTELPAI